MDIDDNKILMKYILVSVIDDYPENGGGIQFDVFDTPEALDRKVQEIYNFRDILIAGEIHEFKYKEVEEVTKIERDMEIILNVRAKNG